MEKTFDWASWETVEQRSFFAGENCGVCEAPAFHIAVAEDEGADGDVEVIRARCKDHFNKLTQKTWLKGWRRKNCNDCDD